MPDEWMLRPNKQLLDMLVDGMSNVGGRLPATQPLVRRYVAQVVEHSAVKVWILLYGGSILHGGCICSLGYFSF